MAETAPNSVQQVGEENWPDQSGRFRDRIAPYGLRGRATVFLAGLAFVSGLVTYGTATGYLPISNQAQVMGWLLAGNVLITLLLAGLIGASAIRIWYARRRGVAGARLHGRLVGLFALVAVVPSLVVAGFSAATLELGLQAWFSDRVSLVMTNSVAVADRYLANEREQLQRDSIALTPKLSALFETGRVNLPTVQRLLSDEANRRDLDYGVVFSVDSKIFALISRTPQEGTIEVPDRELLEKIDDKQIVITTDPKSGRALALSRLGERPIFMVIGRDVDELTLAHVSRTQEAAGDYQTLESRRNTIQIGFAAFYLLVSLLVLLSAIWLGLWFADQLVTPIGSLIGAAGRVRDGDLAVHLDDKAKDEDIETLRRTFNAMTAQLRAQRDALVDTADELDERRQFTEGVLSGVSAGVLGLDENGQITLANRSAVEMLEKTDAELVGRKLSEAVPELAAMFEEAQRRSARSEGDVAIPVADDQRRLHVRVRPQDESHMHSGGFIVTFDDVTQLVSAQRMAAWADVARRIAHEIKNPLTPIQLSAERLRRKYSGQLEDPKVFDSCTETIVRHVGEIGKMVDEFSSFARMPQPVIREENAAELVRQAVFLQDVAHSEIDFKVLAPEDPIILQCDRRLVGQALTNLLKNAVEALEESPADLFIDTSRCIEASISVGEKHIDIAIQDNGPGLPADVRHNLTEPYVTTREKGTGLGLAIVTKVMEDHGGELSLEDAVGQRGALMRLRFPKQGQAKQLAKKTGEIPARGN
ncbi:MAG: ATP-binding protein [Alphaproteobacteria bacterium]